LLEVKIRDARRKIADLRHIESALSILVRRCRSARGTVKCPLIASLRGRSSSGSQSAGTRSS